MTNFVTRDSSDANATPAAYCATPGAGTQHSSCDTPLARNKTFAILERWQDADPCDAMS